MNNLCAIHVAREQEGFFAFDRFIKSLARSEPGFDLLIVFKGFKDWREQEKWHNFAASSLSTEVSSATMSDFGYDLTAYRLGAESFRHEFVACFNSGTELVCPQWARRLTDPLKDISVGIVGATGSWESFCHGCLRRLVFPAFPNPHVRTNAFAMRREVMLKVWPRRFWTKRGCYLFESGHDSLTRRLFERGLKAVVSDRLGFVSEWRDFISTNTFRGNRGGGWLIAKDDQTRRYDELTPAGQRLLRLRTWGVE
jgi:hypothetical protein